MTVDKYYEDYKEDIRLNELLYKDFESIFKRIETAIYFESNFKIDTLKKIINYVKFRYDNVLKKLSKLKYICTVENIFMYSDDFKDMKLLFDYYWKFYYKLIKLQKEYLKTITNRGIKNE